MCLAYLLIQQQDGAGLMLFDSAVREQVPVSSNRANLLRMVDLIERNAPAAATDTRALFAYLAEHLPRRSMVILISDLLADVNDIVSGLQRFRFAQHDVLVLHVLDRDELEFPFTDRTLFEGLEQADLELLTDPQSLRTAYLERLQAFISQIRAACLNNRGGLRPDQHGRRAGCGVDAVPGEPDAANAGEGLGAGLGGAAD